jgi:hypothetical protein
MWSCARLCEEKVINDSAAVSISISISISISSVAGSSGGLALGTRARRDQTARRSNRWWRPPTSGTATMSPSPGAMTGHGSVASLSSATCVRPVRSTTRNASSTSACPRRSTRSRGRNTRDAPTPHIARRTESATAHAAPIVGEQHQHEHEAARHGRHHEEIRRDDLADVIR